MPHAIHFFIAMRFEIGGDTAPVDRFGSEDAVGLALGDVREEFDGAVVFGPAKAGVGFADVEHVEEVVRRQEIDRAVMDNAAAVGDEQGGGPMTLSGRTAARSLKRSRRSGTKRSAIAAWTRASGYVTASSFSQPRQGTFMTSIRSGLRVIRAWSSAVSHSVRQAKVRESSLMPMLISPESGAKRQYGIEFSNITYDFIYRHSIMLVEHPSG